MVTAPKKLLFASVLCVMGSSVADGKTPPPVQEETGEHGGLLVRVGDERLEVVLWETGIEVHPSDKLRPAVKAGKVTGKVELTPTPARKQRPITVSLAPRGDYLHGGVELTGLRAARVRLTLVVDGKTTQAEFPWTREKDRARLNDRRVDIKQPPLDTPGRNDLKGMKKPWR
jgi:hypothetical protein